MKGIANGRGALERPIRLIVCDLAGTTVDFGSRAPAGAFVELFRHAGVECSEAEARVPMGMHKRDHIREMLKQPALAERWRIRMGRSWTEEDVEHLYQRFLPLQTASLLAFNQVISCASEAVVQWRAEGRKVMATTGYNREMTRLVVEDAARQGLVFDGYCCAEDVAAGRPAPWMIYRCMEASGIYPPSAVLAVGDTIADIESGRNAGVWTVGVTRTGNMLGVSEEEAEGMDAEERRRRLELAALKMKEAGAHIVCESLGDLPELLREMELR